MDHCNRTSQQFNGVQFMETKHNSEPSINLKQASLGSASMIAAHGVTSEQPVDACSEDDSDLRRRQIELPDVITIPPIVLAPPTTSTPYIVAVITTPLAMPHVINTSSAPIFQAGTTQIPAIMTQPFLTSITLFTPISSSSPIPIIFPAASPEATQNVVLTFPAAAALTTALPTSSPALRSQYAGSTMVKSTSRGPRPSASVSGTTNATRIQFEAAFAKSVSSKQIVGISIGSVVGVIALILLIAGWVVYGRHRRRLSDGQDALDAIYGAAGEKVGASGKVFEIRQLFRRGSSVTTTTSTTTKTTDGGKVPWRKPVPPIPSPTRRPVTQTPTRPPRIVVAREVNRPYPLSIIEEFAASPSSSSSSSSNSRYSTDMELPFRLGSPVRQRPRNADNDNDNDGDDDDGEVEIGQTARRSRPAIDNHHRARHPSLSASLSGGLPISSVLPSRWSEDQEVIKPKDRAGRGAIPVSRNSMQRRFEQAGRIDLNSPYDEFGAEHDARNGSRSARDKVYDLLRRVF